MSDRSYDIKPIETPYKGFLFRSRLEARWAVFMDVLGLKWKYENDGYDIEGIKYLPDFFVNHPIGIEGWGFWVEIKPTPLNDKEIEFFDNVARVTGHHTFVVTGQPWHEEHLIYYFENYRHRVPKEVPFLIGKLAEIHDGSKVDQAAKYLGYQCNNWYVTKVYDHSNLEMTDFAGHNGIDHRKPSGTLAKAFRAARSARFEHGQSPL